MNSISNEFYSSISKAGHLVADCNCGITHFATGQRAPDYEEGELDNLREKAKKNPERYSENATDDFIEAAHLSGLVYVTTCHCGFLKRIENFIWGNRQMIAEYLKKRTAKEKEEKDSDFKMMEEL